jgi:hypothetical protein
VRWPASGLVERFEDVAGDRIVALVEGSGRLVEKRYREAPAAPRVDPSVEPEPALAAAGVTMKS